MGASPDGGVTCTCHGTGICEIKCPHRKQEEANLRLCAGEQGFCLVNDGGTVKLDRRHAYYHQVQAQLHLVDVDYCDFVVWTKNDLFVERIVRDVDLWDNIIPRVESFFRLCVLPEVLGQQLTRGKFQLQDDQEGEKAGLPAPVVCPGPGSCGSLLVALLLRAVVGAGVWVCVGVFFSLPLISPGAPNLQSAPPYRT
ncbi:uncharacterized protein LOC117545435 isoform X2 [Gymnodraco acuticeps]|uniref:Uncharacterized protein LOC117545435 isoform X2 n=1 Tax=Gymnodraco acuticeps TaxID=8218 RepID=A0A6P8U311_GYMAC|nr:uncharacterized protein LOC117545435 isoform X2 [Gymnodraco acuticeps]